MHAETLTRSTGFQKRLQRKIDMKDVVLGVLAVEAAGRLSFERVASSFARCACEPHTKRVLHKRPGASARGFCWRRSGVACSSP